MEFCDFAAALTSESMCVLVVQLANDLFGLQGSSVTLFGEIETNSARIAGIAFARDEAAALQRSYQFGDVNRLQSSLFGEFALARTFARTDKAVKGCEYRVLSVREAEMGERTVDSRAPAQAQVPDECSGCP